MKKTDIVWVLIIGLWAYAAFANIRWLSLVIVPLLVGLFAIMTSTAQVNDMNAFYAKWSKKIPFLFPPSLSEKTSPRAQHWVTILIGVLALLFGIYNLLVMVHVL